MDAEVAGAGGHDDAERRRALTGHDGEEVVAEGEGLLAAAPEVGEVVEGAAHDDRDVAGVVGGDVGDGHGGLGGHLEHRHEAAAGVVRGAGREVPRAHDARGVDPGVREETAGGRVVSGEAGLLLGLGVDRAGDEAGRAIRGGRGAVGVAEGVVHDDDEIGVRGEDLEGVTEEEALALVGVGDDLHPEGDLAGRGGAVRVGDEEVEGGGRGRVVEGERERRGDGGDAREAVREVEPGRIVVGGEGGRLDRDAHAGLGARVRHGERARREGEEAPRGVEAGARRGERRALPLAARGDVEFGGATGAGEQGEQGHGRGV
jgi:hypothetical protein